ncbi:molybdenum cofactor guanylyltransferase [Paenibacillus sp. sgz500958]|uniref:molybdenum cofactor guanylyltransferase n=1 Tax=Paenibacillus sp. sgz500958 TaxID=3242475 RepID=UPI0036D2101D
MKIKGILLAGGHSRRMGVNKALLEIGEEPLISRLLSQLLIVAESVMVSSGERDTNEYEFLGVKIIPDQYPGLGPLGGLHAGLSSSDAEWNVVMACDLPFAHHGLLQALLAIVQGAGTQVQAVIPVAEGGKVQPLLAFYHRSVLPSLEEVLKQRRLRVLEWLEGLNVIYVPVEDFPHALFNMNTPEDYRTAVQRVHFAQDEGSE